MFINGLSTAFTPMEKSNHILLRLLLSSYCASKLLICWKQWSPENDRIVRKAIIYCDCAASYPNYVWWTLMWQLVLVLLHSTQLKIKMLRETRRTWWVAAIVPVIRTVNVNCILPFMYVDMSKWQEAEQGSGNEARHELCSSVVLVNYNFN